MQDPPSLDEILEAVHDFLTNVAMAKLDGHDAFHARVAANGIAIVRRALEIAPQAEAAERERLKSLLGRDGTLEELNRALCERIRAGDLGFNDPALTDHLWKTTLAKLAIDQPNYASYRRETGRT